MTAREPGKIPRWVIWLILAGMGLAVVVSIIGGAE